MQHEPNLNPDARNTADLLAACRPADHQIDRDDLLFRAGAASARKRLWLWRGVSTALAAGLALSVLLRLAPAPPRPQRIVYVDRIVEKRELIPFAALLPVTIPSDELASRIDPREFQLRQDIIRYGPGILPRPTPSASSAPERPLDLGIPASQLGVGGILLHQFNQQKGEK